MDKATTDLLDLDTTGGLIKLLGGPAEVARLTGRKIQQVNQWRVQGWFSPETFLVMSTALAARGVHPSPRLWRQTQVA